MSRRTIERPLNWCPETLIHSDLQEAGNAHSATNATFRPNCLSTEKMINSMRYIFLPAVLIFLFSCKKESRQTSNSLIGKWELHQTFGGMMPTANYAPGNGNLLRFDSTHYEMIRNGQVVDAGSYRLAVDSFTDINSCALLPPASTSPNWILSDSASGLRTYFEIKDDVLKMTSSCMPVDGGGALYKRVLNKE